MADSRLDVIARECRQELGLGNFDALPLTKLAEVWGVKVISVTSEDLLVTEFDRISSPQGKRLEGLAFRSVDGPVVVIDDRLHRHRLRSVGAHELAHVILEHIDHPRACEGMFEGARTKDPIERTANDLGARLLVTGDSARIAASMGWTLEKVAQQFDISIPMARWRWNTSGATRAARKRRA